VEREVRRQPLRGRRVHAALPVANRDGGGGRLTVLVEHAERQLVRRVRREQDLDVAAEAEVLRALADVERDLRRPLAHVAAVELDHAVLELQPGQLLAGQRPAGEERQVQPAVLHFLLRRVV